MIAAYIHYSYQNSPIIGAVCWQKMVKSYQQPVIYSIFVNNQIISAYILINDFAVVKYSIINGMFDNNQ